MSNVPAQALSLMNGAFVLQQARRWAERTLANPSLDTAVKRIQSLYQTAYARPPAAVEEKDAVEFLQAQARRYRCAPDDPRVWTDLCHVLINVKEFIFVR